MLRGEILEGKTSRMVMDTLDFIFICQEHSEGKDIKQ